MDEYEMRASYLLAPLGPVPAGQAKYDIRDAVEFTTKNIGSLSVIFQFLVGLIAAWRKPSVPR
jgi:hypothetical protein